jgi:Ecdysteroid kinase-like family
MTESKNIGVLPLPTDVDRVDAPWLSQALGVQVASAQIVDLIRGASTKIRIRLETDNPDIPSTLIVKGGFEPHSPKLREMYAIEALFYREVAPVLPIRVPRSWFAESDPSSHQSIIIMEDLTQSGVTFLHVSKPSSYEQAAVRLRALAKFHASTWNDNGFAPGGRWAHIQARFSNPFFQGYIDHYLSAEVWKSYMDSPRGACVSTRLRDREWMRHALSRLGQLEREGPLCIIHGDAHQGNLYLEQDGTPGFLDQQIAKASPFLEVSYNVIGGLDQADRARYEQALLGVYLEALAAEGVDVPDFDYAWLAYRQTIASALFIFLINETLFQPEWVNTAYTARYGAAAVDHDVIGLLS